jgi:hypothetical protein
MIKTINAENGGMIHVIKNEPGLGTDETSVNVMVELNNPVVLNAEETEELLQNIEDVKNS